MNITPALVLLQTALAFVTLTGHDETVFHNHGH
jgi:hypothetical protein